MSTNQMLPKVGNIYKNLAKDIPKYPEDIPQYPDDIPKISQRYPQNIPKISPKYPQDMINRLYDLSSVRYICRPTRDLFFCSLPL